MAEITSNESFDPDELEPEVAEQLEPLLEWLAETMQVIIPALQGQLGDRNMSSQYVRAQATVGVRQSFRIDGPVSNVQIVNVVSQAESTVYYTGFNWWRTQDGFDYVVTYTGDKTDRSITMKVEFDL
jgi:hypothetical protein